MRFINHSVYDNWTVSTSGNNVSSIVDKLIRLAAKNTEHYASDIVYYINAFMECVEEHRAYAKYLGFRDGGVNLYDSVDWVHDGTGVVQWWKLTYDPETEETILIRQDLVG